MLLVAAAAVVESAQRRSQNSRRRGVASGWAQRHLWRPVNPRGSNRINSRGSYVLKDPKEFRIIGKPTKVADCADIVSGRARYGIDAQMPGMLYAVIARSQYFDGTLRSLDDSAAKKMRGVRAIVPLAGPRPSEDLVRNLAAGVAVVADNTWAAMQARKALKIDWAPGVWAKDSTQALEARARAAVAGDDNVQTGRSAAT
jgi:hypothetical protein